MKKGLFYTLLFFMTVTSFMACHKDRNSFVLNGLYSPDGREFPDSMILVTGIDNRFERTDTIFPSDGSFTWSLTPDTITPLLLIFPNGTMQAVFADKGVTAQLFIPDSGNIKIGGGYCNDSYQAFKDRVHEGVTENEITEMIDSFIKADPFSEVTPMLIYEYMIQMFHADRKDVEALIRKMSGNMQDCPFIVDIKSAFGGESSSNNYISSIDVVDTAMVKTPFSSIGENQHLLVCIWASWDESGNEARKQMARFKEVYSDRQFTIADISIDTNTRRWKETVGRDTLDWSSYCDTQGWGSRILRDGQIQDLPVYVLFSGLKRIILKTGSFSEMDLLLESELPVKKKNEKITPRKFRINGM